MLLFASKHMVVFKTKHNVFFRRLFGVESVERDEFDDFWILSFRCGGEAYIPIKGTVVRFGRGVQAKK